MLKQITCEVGINKGWGINKGINEGSAWWGGRGEERKWDRNIGIWENRCDNENHNYHSKFIMCKHYVRASHVALVVKSPPANAGDTRNGLHPWVGKTPWRRKWHSTSVSLPGKLHGQRSLVGHSPRGHREPELTERLSRAAPWEALCRHHGAQSLQNSSGGVCLIKEEAELQNIEDWPSSPDLTTWAFLGVGH